MHVGLPCMKLSLSPSTQKHLDKKSGTCSVKSAWDEMNDKRKGRDVTIDRSLTDRNVWITGNAEMDMVAEIQKKVDLVNEDKRAHGKRALRCDAVTGLEMIEKPPLEYMEHLTREEQIKFLQDSSEVMDSLLQEWNPNWITMAQVIHFDEFGGKSPHSHRIVAPITKDKDGVLAFNAKAEFNLKFFTFVNKEYPKRMRERGYEVEDCKIYEEMTPEQKEEHRKNRPEHGVEGFEYKRKKNAELAQAIGEKEVLLAEKMQAIEETDAVIADKNEHISGLNKEIKDQKTKKKELIEANKEIETRILIKKQVQELPEPSKTFGGDYKVEPQRYKSLVATAARVDKVRERETAVEKKEKALEQMRQNLENDRKIPVKEQVELLQLRKLKEIVIKLTQRLPDGLVKKVLLEALKGKDILTESNEHRKQHTITQHIE